MNVYILKADPNEFQVLVADDKATWREVLFCFDGRTLSSKWTPPTLRIYAGDIADGKPAGDFPNLISFIPVFSKRALNVLGDLLADSGEILGIDKQDRSFQRQRDARQQLLQDRLELFGRGQHHPTPCPPCRRQGWSQMSKCINVITSLIQAFTPCSSGPA